MKRLFLDTAGWMACADDADPAHKESRRARDHWLDDRGALVTTDYILDETLTLIRMRLGLRAAERWWEQVESSARLQWENIGNDRVMKARDLFFQIRDKDLSFTDCTSFVVMRELKLRQALTTDQHFRQMGFETLPS